MSEAVLGQFGLILLHNSLGIAKPPTRVLDKGNGISRKVNPGSRSKGEGVDVGRQRHSERGPA